MQDMPHRPLAQGLTYAGTLPLIACAIAVWTGWPMGIDAVFVAVAYGAVIASFLAGIHWAAYLFDAQHCKHNLLIASNAIALAAWASVWIGGLWGCVVLVLCFALLFALDVGLHARGVLPTWFFRLRRDATIVVIAMLIATLIKAALLR
jgi:hypothetical protein